MPKMARAVAGNTFSMETIMQKRGVAIVPSAGVCGLGGGDRRRLLTARSWRKAVGGSAS